MNGKDTALFTHNSDEYETPQWLFDELDKEFHFQVDAAALRANAKCDHYYDPLTDALCGDWYKNAKELGINPSFWLNPPYSKIAAFMKKAYEESLKGATVVCLIPVRSDTKYWHEYVMRAQQIRFVKGRLKFGDSKNSAPFPSVIVIFDIHMQGLLGGPHPDIGETIEQPAKAKK